MNESKWANGVLSAVPCVRERVEVVKPAKEVLHGFECVSIVAQHLLHIVCCCCCCCREKSNLFEKGSSISLGPLSWPCDNVLGSLPSGGHAVFHLTFKIEFCRLHCDCWSCCTLVTLKLLYTFYGELLRLKCVLQL